MAQRIVWGCINADGSTHSGDQFTAIHSSAGTYEVVYSTRFKTAPAVILQQNFEDWKNFSYGGGSTMDNCVLVASDETKLKVATGGGSGQKTDRNFAFIAVGEV
ncbi:MAG TPA: hypothetical protein VGM86_02805 [Thermoanaerobaculia bacterium]|jgi:hypothetical protein